MRFRPRRLGLRARITLAFALGALLLSVGLSASTWAFTRESQLNQRHSQALNTALENAEKVRDNVLSDALPPQMRDALQSNTSTLATGIVLRQGVGSSEPTTTSTSLRLSYDEIPRSLRDTVAEGSAATMRYRLGDTPVLALGVPLPSVNAEYFELVELDELEQSLDLIAAYLTGASILTTMAGAALGWWASRRTLLPLTDVGLAAHAIAAGRLDTRLEAANDPDLAVLVSSFNEMAATLEARIERDAQFASDVSHELRSPLMTLAASVEVLQTRRDDMPERSRAALDLLVDDVNRFQQLVSDLLEISRFDAGAAHLELEPVHLPEFLSQAVGAASHDSVPVIADDRAAELVVEIDKRRMARVVANLLDNARKYAEGATAIRVFLGDDAVDIVVEDRGPGIDEADRSRIFERFARGVTSAGSRGADTGSGLGLALVAEHVALHGGRTSVHARPDGEPGAWFVVTLPVDPSLVEPTDADTKPAPHLSDVPPPEPAPPAPHETPVEADR